LAALFLVNVHQKSEASDAMGEDFDYAKGVQSPDLDAVVKDLP
jgi:catalase (peroxidase I)